MSLAPGRGGNEMGGNAGAGNSAGNAVQGMLCIDI